VRRCDLACGLGSVFEAVLAETGRLDILVNNARGAVRIAQVTDTTNQEIEESIAVNLTGAIFRCRRAAEVMKRQKRRHHHQCLQRLPEPGLPGLVDAFGCQGGFGAVLCRASA
jgi:NAD(P)-dependent dehydrogenase (short-subunit alcohol dehydrogenase family)